MAYSENEATVVRLPIDAALAVVSRTEFAVESGEQIVRNILSEQIQKLDVEGLTKVAHFMRSEGLSG